MQLDLIAQENWNGFPQRNRKNKNRNFYSWKISKFSHNNQSKDVQIDIFPSTSENRGIQIIKSEIILMFNQTELFNFSYVPQELDFLEIKSLKDSDEYLNLIFMNGKWEEEVFIFTKRNYFDIYTNYKEGYFELT